MSRVENWDRASLRRPQLDDIGRRRFDDRTQPVIPERQSFALLVDILVPVIHAFDTGANVRKHSFANFFANPKR